jgi:hypothetical protein
MVGERGFEPPAPASRRNSAGRRWRISAVPATRSEPESAYWAASGARSVTIPSPLRPRGRVTRLVAAPVWQQSTHSGHKHLPVTLNLRRWRSLCHYLATVSQWVMRRGQHSFERATHKAGCFRPWLRRFRRSLPAEEKTLFVFGFRQSRGLSRHGAGYLRMIRQTF